MKTKKRKPTLAKKTQIKIKWLDLNHKKFKYRQDLIKAFSKKYELTLTHAERILLVWEGKKKNTSSWRFITKINDGKKYINKNKCYFCPSKKKLLEHHISYNPEIIALVCYSCHTKIHNILKIQHNLEKTRARYISNLDKKIQDLQKTHKNVQEAFLKS